MARPSRRFTIFDAMEHAGIFEANPANLDSRDIEGNSAYRGPVAFPKMLYHPEGKEHILNPGTTELVAGQYVKVNEQKELDFVVVKDAKEEREYLAKGWHTHPSRAIAARTGEAPPTVSDTREQDLLDQIAKLQADLAASRSEPVAPPPSKPIGLA